MLNLNRVVPNSNNRYILNIYGDIVDVHIGEIISTNVDGVKIAKLDWYDGFRTYDVGQVAVITQTNIKIPVEHWNKIEAVYRDNDRTNTLSINLYYRFTSNIPVDGWEGFYYIPYYTRYGMSRTGELLDVKTGTVKNWYVLKPRKDDPKNARQGYRVTNVIADRHVGTNISRHRALALVFIPYPGDPFELVVNHKDGIGGNDCIDNLEWCTYSENTKHAYANGLQPNNVRPLLVKEMKSGRITRYESVAECARSLGFKHATILGRLREHNGKSFKDGYAMKEDDDSPWIDNDPITAYKRLPVACWHVFTNTLIIVNDTLDAEQKTGVKSGTVLAHIARDSKIPWNGYLFRWFSEDMGKFPSYNRWQLELFKKDRPRSDVCGWLETDTENGEQRLYLLKELAAKLSKTVSQTKLILNEGRSKCGRFRYEKITPEPLS